MKCDQYQQAKFERHGFEFVDDYTRWHQHHHSLPPFFQDEYTIIIPAVWTVIIIVGCIGNGLVIYTLCKNGEMTPTNCYVVNLAAADMTFILVVMPITAIAFAMPKEWTFGDLMCKMSIYMVYVSIKLELLWVRVCAMFSDIRLCMPKCRYTKHVKV